MLSTQKNIQNPAFVIGSNALISNIKEADIPLYIGSEKGNNFLHFNNDGIQKFIFSPYNSSKFIDELCEIGEDFSQKPVLFCDDDRAILRISNHRERLEKYFMFLYPSVENVNRLLDKQRFSEYAKRLQLPVPQFFQVFGLNEIREVVPFITFPCILKPSNPLYWQNKKITNVLGGTKEEIRCANSEKQIEAYSRVSKISRSAMVQEVVVCEQQKHFSVNIFIDRLGVLRDTQVAFKRRNEDGLQWKTCNEENVIAICKEIIAKLDLKGLINFQLKQDCRTGEFKLLKIAPKNKHWDQSGRINKSNLVELYYQHLVHENWYFELQNPKSNGHILN